MLMKHIMYTMPDSSTFLFSASLGCVPVGVQHQPAFSSDINVQIAESASQKEVGKTPRHLYMEPQWTSISQDLSPLLLFKPTDLSC